MKKIIKSKKAVTAHTYEYVLYFALGLITVIILITQGGDSIKSIWKSIVPFIDSVKEASTPEIDISNYVSESLGDNVYSAIVIQGDKDAENMNFGELNHALVKQFKDVQSNDQLANIGCDPGEEFPRTLNAAGCYIIASEQDSWVAGDDCATHHFVPERYWDFGESKGLDGSYLIRNPSFLGPLNTPIGPAKEILEEQCLAGFDCQNDALNLLYQFYSYSSGVFGGDLFVEDYFYKQVICVSPKPGIFVWAKCDSSLPSGQKINSYVHNEELIYECTCNANSCEWNKYMAPATPTP